MRVRSVRREAVDVVTAARHGSPAAARPAAFLLILLVLAPAGWAAQAAGAGSGEARPVTPSTENPLVESLNVSEAGSSPNRGVEVNGWSLAASLIVERSEHGVAELDGRIYVLGGYPPGRLPSNVVQVYDPETNRWELGPPLPVPLHHVMAASVGGKLYAIGGEMDGAGTGRPPIFLNTVYELDPRVDGWVARASMPTSRSGGGAAVVDGRIYVAGGRPPRGHDFARYDPATDSWEVLPDIPTQRNHLAVAALGGKVLVAGGRFGGGFNSETTPALEIYDPAAGTWSAAAPMPTARGGVAGVAANGCLFVIGGEGNPEDVRGLFEENEVYDPGSDSWRSLAPLPTPVHGLGAAAFVDGRVHLPGGAVTQGGNTGSNIHQVFRPTVSCGTRP